MGHRFADIAFTESVQALQRQQGSREGYATMQAGSDYNYILRDAETQFIGDRDSFYMASVGENGWPYIQHRGGPAGFVRVLDERTLGFADFSGNRQYISTGNFVDNDRVALFFMDYANQRRLKLLGRVTRVELSDHQTMTELEPDDYRAPVERGFVIKVEAFDWNCPKYITPRYNQEQLEEMIAPLINELQHLKTSKPGNSVQQNYPQELGEGPLSLVISGIRQLTARVRAYELRDINGGDLPPVSGGAHLQIPVQLEDGNLIHRHYSICSNPQRRDIYEIAVLEEPQGEGGSRAVHNHFQLGLRLNCPLPGNYFPLHQDARPAILIAGGIGITPIKAMAQELESRGAEFQLHYAGRSADQMAFLDRLQRQLESRLHVYLGDQQQRIDLDRLLKEAPAESLIYICGPEALIQGGREAVGRLGIDPQRIRYERFQVAHESDDQPFEVELKRSGKTVEVAADQTLLEAIEEKGIDAPFGCRAGNCRSCVVQVLEGEADHRDTTLTAEERNQQQLMAPCVSRACGDRLVLDL